MITTAESRGLVLNDGHGLLLKAEGDLADTARDQKNGFFTCIAEKAIDLGQVADGNDDSDVVKDDAQCVPIVRLETSRRALVIAKFETGGHERTLVVSKSSPVVDTALE